MEIINCKVCGVGKPTSEFYKCSTCISGFRKICKKCHVKKCVNNQKNNLFRLEKIKEWTKNNPDRRKMAARKYGQSTKGKARKMYHNMVWRTSNIKCYKNIKVKITMDEFLNWAIPEIELYLQKNPGGAPSVDRINPDSNYEFGNIRIIDTGLNTIKSRFITKCLGLNPQSSDEDKLNGLKKIVDSFCENLNMPKMKLVYENNL